MPRRISKRETDSLPAEIHNYKVAKQNGERFYIAAWLEGSQLPQVFVLGDGKLYGGYHNAPLQPETKYTLYVRGVTEADGVGIVCYLSLMRAICGVTVADRVDTALFV